MPPGGEGKIKLRIRTKGYHGNIQKSARVYTNDPNNKVVRLRVKAFVKTPIYISSRHVNLYGKEYQTLITVVEVRAELDRPLKLTPVHFNLAEKLSYTIQEIEKGRKFRIRFTSIPGPAQAYHGILKIKTNYPEKPEIVLRIRGSIRKAS
ncbi:MAG: hypothetical protein JRJ69_08485 [Deltaproteobacteria bacterium]|nr:hypothetical protein [Deltaproteobacteria bacterium]MBW1737574.1 hypothetical protein [Deltaproteobacteria bacterium]MBW1911435.1 hypothetical protein [Deltaproteobacteria bacterium]MBW2035572.1 hypothetical protein [Deltaproteobacteria bacterium]MBW2115169.1 hypothetical protein [Deltaproteobacteria bacterium]